MDLNGEIKKPDMQDQGLFLWLETHRRILYRVVAYFIVPVFILLFLWTCMIRMPGESIEPPLPKLTDIERDRSDRLSQHVHHLADEIGSRNMEQYENLQAAADYIEGTFTEYGYDPERIPFEVDDRVCSNLEVVIDGTGARDEHVVVGAHYDTVPGSPGADDNASGVAGLLELARLFKDDSPDRTLRLVAFANEEAPYFHTHAMGSQVYARQLKEKNVNVVGMISLEMIGYYTDEKAQAYPLPGLSLLYPAEGNFIAFVSNLTSRHLLYDAIEAFRAQATIPSEGGALPAWVPGISLSDHSSFWQVGYPAIMITNTAMYRNPYYHLAQDTPDKLNYNHMARTVRGMEAVLQELLSK